MVLNSLSRAILSISLATLFHTVASQNADCALVVPFAPLTAAGLATPYVLKALDPAKGPCVMSDTGQQSFVEATIFDPANGRIRVYHPLVVSAGKVPAITPVMPTLSATSVVGLWFGTNADTLTLLNDATNTSLVSGKCVNGLPGDIFGQFAACNAAAFWDAINNALMQGKTFAPPVPNLGRASDGLPCLTSRDFALVDADPNDNVATQYLVTANGQTAVSTPNNRAALPNATLAINGSDENLLVVLDTIMSCAPYVVPDLSDPARTNVPSLALNELHALLKQATPRALIQKGNPMVRLASGSPSLAKVNLYRQQVNQPFARNLGEASTVFYCFYYATVQLNRVAKNQALLTRAATPAADVGSNMYTFLMARFSASFATLQCDILLDNQTPLVVLTLNADGVVTDANINMAVTNALSRDVDTYLCTPRTKWSTDESGSNEQNNQLGDWGKNDKSGLHEQSNQIGDWCEDSDDDL